MTWWGQLRQATRIGIRGFSTKEDRFALVVVFVVSTLSGLALTALALAGPLGQKQDSKRLETAISQRSAWTGLRVAESFVKVDDRRRIERLAVAAESGASANVPGLSRPPREGEVWASPGLLRLAESRPEVRRLWPHGLTGVIRPDGLISPNQLRLYQGVPNEDLAQVGYVAKDFFGSNGFSIPAEREQSRAAAMAGFLLFAVIPMFALLASSLRQLSTLRADRERRLAAIGMSRSASTLATTLDGVVAAATGSAAGAISALVIASHVSRIPGLPASWWPSDVQVPWGAIAGIVGAELLWSVLILSSRARVRGMKPPLGRRTWWGPVVLFAGGLGVLATRGMRIDETDGTTALLGAALISVVVGLVGSIPWAVTRAGRIMHGYSHRESVRVAGARLVRGPTATRGAGVLIVLTALAGTAAVPLVGQVAPRDAQTPATNVSLGRVLAEVSGVPAGVDLKKLLGPEVDVSVAKFSGSRREFAFNCEQLRRIGSGSCEAAPVAVQSLPADVVTTFPGPGNTFLVKGQPQFVTSRPTESDIAGSRGAPILAILPANEAALVKAQIAVAALPGVGTLTPVNGGLIGGTNQPFSILQDWLRVALAGCLLVGVALALLGLLEDARSRRRADSSLVVLGVSRARTRRSHRIEVGIRMACLVSLTGAVCVVLSGTMASWSGVDRAPAGWMATIVGGLVLLAAVSVVSAPAMVDLRDPVSAMRRD